MVTPTSVKFGLQMGGDNVYNMEGLMGFDISDEYHTTVVTPTKMECSAMIIIDKGLNKGDRKSVV